MLLRGMTWAVELSWLGLIANLRLRHRTSAAAPHDRQQPWLGSESLNCGYAHSYGGGGHDRGGKPAHDPPDARDRKFPHDLFIRGN